MAPQQSETDANVPGTLSARSSNDSGGGGVSKTTSVDAGVSAAGGAEGSGVTNDKPRLNENVDPDASGGGGGGGNRKRAGPSG